MENHGWVAVGLLPLQNIVVHPAETGGKGRGEELTLWNKSNLLTHLI